MQKYQKTLDTIFYHFKHSSKKIDTLSAIQDVLDEPQLKYRVHQVRWLSFYEALMAIQRTLDSLITYLIEQSKHDAVANGLKKSVAQELFHFSNLFNDRYPGAHNDPQFDSAEKRLGHWYCVGELAVQ